MKRIVLLMVGATLAIVGCKSAPQIATEDDEAVTSEKDDGDSDDLTGDGSVGHVPMPVGEGDGGNGDSVIIADDDDDEPACVPKTCEELGAECGPINTNCRDFVRDCGKCEDGAECGIVERNKCTKPTDLCVPLSKEKACKDKECGQEGDGCDGSYDCGSCPDGEVCGIVKASQCDPAPGQVDDAGIALDCIPASADEACAGKECGLVFDGCGADDAHKIDCAEVNGGCAADEYCGLEQAFQCAPLMGTECTAAGSCQALGWACGTAVDDCGNVYNCSDEGLSCDAATQSCIGGVTGPTECVTGNPGSGGSACDVCDAIADCSNAPAKTRILGRVVTPGKSDDDTANQVGVPNAFVYILRNDTDSELPAMSSGIPAGGTACDRCDDQDLGPVLVGATTNSHGEYTLEGDIPVGKEFVLVVKIGKWRRAERITLDQAAGCTDTTLASIKTRLPRSSADGLGAHIPHIGITTGGIDAMECVFYKMGVAESEFAQPGTDATAAARIHMYRSNGASMSDGSTPDDDLFDTEARLFAYDMLVFDCMGPDFAENRDLVDPQTNVRHYVNSGGRLFASHLSYTWLYDNGTDAYSADTAIETGLSAAGTFPGSTTPGPDDDTGTGIVSIGRPRANPGKIQAFADWLVNEGAATDNNGQYTFPIIEPRELASVAGDYSDEFVYREMTDASTWVQSFAFNTPYGSPEDAICGRVAYTAFHVSASGQGANAQHPFGDAIFPAHCTGDLTDQEKVLLYMLFDLGACVTTDTPPEPPGCTPIGECTGRCGAVPDGCGGTLQCSCPDGEICLPSGMCTGTDCTPSTCDAQDAECGSVADGCGGVIPCGPCPEGQVCGLVERNKCADIPNCPAITCEDADVECGVIGDGCGGQVTCGPCPKGEVCGIKKAFQCDPPPECEPITCEDQDAECGKVSDGCSHQLDCGDCPAGQSCGEDNQCHRPDDVH
ncbi:MAG TPA: hypothetical protein VHM70_07920 [Polyangiaceae bacterium]|nr:hypothetical protein [Polyangiaceae bacterium]